MNIYQEAKYDGRDHEERDNDHHRVDIVLRWELVWTVDDHCEKTEHPEKPAGEEAHPSVERELWCVDDRPESEEPPGKICDEE